VTLYEGLGPTVRHGTVTRHVPRVTHPSYAATPPLTAELSAFLAMIRTGTPPRSPLSQGTDTIRVLAAADRSIARGAWIAL
jgi:predicted dehydrogenase